MALDYSIIGNRIKTIRKKKKITQATLAEALDVSDSTISRIDFHKFEKEFKCSFHADKKEYSDEERMKLQK